VVAGTGTLQSIGKNTGAIEDLRIHALYGSMFESYVISELLNNYMNRDGEHAIYFWRDSTGNEIDVNHQ
jgi:hypothetical protein